MTFDSVPWVVTMKKNEHYFPTAELVKDPREECGWRRITYEGGGRAIEGEGSDNAAAVAAAEDVVVDMDQGQ